MICNSGGRQAGKAQVAHLPPSVSTLTWLANARFLDVSGFDLHNSPDRGLGATAGLTGQVVNDVVHGIGEVATISSAVTYDPRFATILPAIWLAKALGTYLLERKMQSTIRKDLEAY